MHKIFLLDFEYIGIEEFLKKRLNVNNLKTTSKKKIALIGRNIKPYYFDIYKRNLLFEYFDLKNEPTSRFISEINSQLKKLDLNLESYEYKYINQILKEEFALRRSKKSIEINFKTLNSLKRKNPFFLEKKVKVYKKVNQLYEYIDIYNLFFYDNHIVLEKKNIIDLDIGVQEIVSIVDKKIGIEVTTETNSILFKTVDNKILKIYFERSFTKKILKKQ